MIFQLAPAARQLELAPKPQKDGLAMKNTIENIESIASATHLKCNSQFAGRRKTSKAMLVTLFLMSGMAAKRVDATPIRVSFTGIWRIVIPYSGPVQPGDPFTGEFFYDPDAVISSFTGKGITGACTDYRFGAHGAGIELRVSTASGIVTFQSDPSAMYAEVMYDFSNQPGGGSIDRFYLQSYWSALFPSFYERSFERLDIDLVANGRTLVGSTALPLSLRMPSIYASIDLQGGSSPGNLDFGGGGDIHSLRGVPEPGTLVMLGTGLGGLVVLCMKRQKRVST